MPIRQFQHRIVPATGAAVFSFEISAELWADIQAEAAALPVPVTALEYVELQVADAIRALAPDAPASREPDDGILF